MFSKFVTGLVLFAAAMFTVAKSPFNNTIYPAVPMTATSQTSAPLGLQGFSGGAVTLKGTSLTTATIGVLGSADGGLTYFAIPLCTVAVTPVCANTQTATANAMYQVNLVALTNIEFVTSGTFTATSISLTLAASANAQLSKAAAASGGTIPSTTNVLAGDGAGNAADSGLAKTSLALNNGANIFTGGLSTFSWSATLPELAIINPQTGSYGPACAKIASATGTFNDHTFVIGLACNGSTADGSFTLAGLSLGSGDLNLDIPNSAGGFGFIQNPMAIGTKTLCTGSVKLCTANISVTGTATTAASGSINYGGTTAASSNCGTLVGAAACIQINVAGTTRYIPIY